MTNDGSSAARRFGLPAGLTPEEERAIIIALERYFLQESPKLDPWVLQSRIEAIGLGRLQVRKFARDPWHGNSAAFARTGAPSVRGRGDQT
jgi:hypothetical protein